MPYHASEASVSVTVTQEPTEPCTSGQTKCVGFDLYKCVNSQWILQQKNNTTCGYVPPACTEGSETCKEKDLWKCSGGKWVLFQANSPQCQGEIPWNIIAIVGGAAAGLALLAAIAGSGKKKSE